VEYRAYYKMLWTSFYIFGLCGLASVLVDVDHVIALFLWKQGIPITEGRIWHTPIFIISSLVICCMVSYLGGLHIKPFLRRILISMSLIIGAITVFVLLGSPFVVWRLS
jgi:hypothetical protein